MKWRHLEVFRAVMLNRSVTRAAVELRTSQPTASRFLAELEREIGFKLFGREGNRLIPTSEAVAFYKEILRSYVGFDRILTTAKAIADFQDDHLRIASISSWALGPLSQTVPIFIQMYPGVTVSLDVYSFDEIVARVAARQCEVGFTSHPSSDSGLRFESLIQAEAVCVMPADHPLHKRKEIKTQDLRDASFISLEGPSRQRIDKVFSDAGVQRRMIIETQTAAVAICLVRQGAGVAVMDPFTAEALRDPQLVIRPFKPPVVFNFNVALREEEDKPRIVAEFLKVMQQTLQKYSPRPRHSRSTNIRS